MKKRDAEIADARARRELLQLYAPITEFFLRAGVSELELIRALVVSMDRARRAKRPFKIQREGGGPVYSAIMRLWQSLPAYVNSAGRPARLSLAGEVSFTALARAAGSNEEPRKILNTMVKFGSVRMTKSGRIEAITRHMNMRLERVMSYETNQRFMADAIAAMTRGMGSVGGSKRLYGFQNYGDHIPSKYVTEFLASMKARNLAYVEELNEWITHVSLSREQLKKHKGATFRLGVAAFPICSKN
jgi:hypothetical protein